MPKFQKVQEGEDQESYIFECPGCECCHQIWVKGYNIGWTFNGDVDKPTCSPSLLVRMGPKPDPITHLAPKGAPGRVCHSFIKDGCIQFLGDCTHSLAGKTVEIPEFD